MKFETSVFNVLFRRDKKRIYNPSCQIWVKHLCVMKDCRDIHGRRSREIISGSDWLEQLLQIVEVLFDQGVDNSLLSRVFDKLVKFPAFQIAFDCLV